jgi:release factor glutamine methyltransferase
LELKRIDLYLRYDQPLNEVELAQYKRLIKKRIQREPVAYIMGYKEFWSMDMAVCKDVLIPRPETECLVEQVLNYLPEISGSDPWKVLDLGTGSGAIILSLMSERPGHQFFASDYSLKSIEIAHKNSRTFGFDNMVNFFLGDWFAPLRSHLFPFDLIVSNPPYIETYLLPTLAPEIYHFEPITALDGGKEGLSSIRNIIDQSPGFLKPGGYLFLEIGYDQLKSVNAIAKKNGRYESVYFTTDYSGNDRVAIMRKSRY